MKVLFVTARPPWPSRRGDQARTAAWVEGLSRRHEVRVLALAPPAFDTTAFRHRLPDGVAGRTCAHGRLPMIFGPLRRPDLPAQVAMHVNRRLQRAFEDEKRSFRPDVVVPVLSRLGWLPGLWNDTEDMAVVVDLVDSLALNMENRARREPLLRPLWRWEARRMAAWDRRLLARVDAAAVVAERDRDAVAGSDEALRAKVEVVPFGLQVPGTLPEHRAEGEIVLLSGNLGYFPTVDAATFFAREVWPRIRAQRPGAEWWLAGARPPKAIRRLAALPGVRLIADPEDLGAVRRRAAVSVVPLRSGSGTPIKVLEAMADGVPLVMTPAAAAGLDGVSEDGAPDAVAAVTGDPSAMAEEVVRLLADPGIAEERRRRAWEWVRERHGLPRVVEAFERLLVRCATPRPPATSP